MAMPSFFPQGTQVVCSITILYLPGNIYSAGSQFSKILRNCSEIEFSTESTANVKLLEEVLERM